MDLHLAQPLFQAVEYPPDLVHLIHQDRVHLMDSNLKLAPCFQKQILVPGLPLQICQHFLGAIMIFQEANALVHQLQAVLLQVVSE